MAKTITPTTVKNNVRSETFAQMVEIFSSKYSENKVYRVGDTEIAVEVATAPTGEPIFATFSPTIKDYCDRKTNTKTIKAYDVAANVKAYENTCANRVIKAEVAAKAKAEKIARDKTARAKAKTEREKAKTDTMTEFKRHLMAADVNVIVKE